MDDAKKTTLEIAKLEAEIREIQKPFFSKPSNWLSIVAALVAVGGLWGQSVLSNIKVERALLDAAEKTAEADARVKEVSASLSAAEGKLEILQSQATASRLLWVELNAERSALEEQIEDARGVLENAVARIRELNELEVDQVDLAGVVETLGETDSILRGECSPSKLAAYAQALEVPADELPFVFNALFPLGLPDYSGPEDSLKPVYQPWWLGAFSEKRKLPIWVGYRLGSDVETKVDRHDCFRPDPRFDPSLMATLEDYRGSGFDRGHLVPSADMDSSDPQNSSVFMFTNITPQHARLNRMAIRNVEQKVRDWAKNYGEVFIVTGPIFDANFDGVADEEWLGQTIGPGKLPVPTHFFKVIYRIDEAGKWNVISFLHPNSSGIDADGASDTFVTSVAHIERLTGLTLFPDLGSPVSADLKDAVNSVSEW